MSERSSGTGGVRVLPHTWGLAVPQEGKLPGARGTQRHGGGPTGLKGTAPDQSSCQGGSAADAHGTGRCTMLKSVPRPSRPQGTPEHALIWKWGLCNCSQVKTRSYWQSLVQ